MKSLFVSLFRHKRALSCWSLSSVLLNNTGQSLKRKKEPLFCIIKNFDTISVLPVCVFSLYQRNMYAAYETVLIQNKCFRHIK